MNSISQKLGCKIDKNAKKVKLKYGVDKEETLPLTTRFLDSF